MTRPPWNDLSYILNSEEWQSLQAVSLACRYQPSVSSGVCSRASNPAWQEVQSIRECIEACQASWSTVRLFSTPLTSMVPRSGLAWHSRQRSVLPVGMVKVTAAAGPARASSTQTAASATRTARRALIA